MKTIQRNIKFHDCNFYVMAQDGSLCRQLLFTDAKLCCMLIFVFDLLSFIFKIYLDLSFCTPIYLYLSLLQLCKGSCMKALVYNFFFFTMQSCAVLLPWLIIFVLNFLNSSLSFEIYLYLSWLQRCQRSTSDNFFFYCHAKLGSAHLIHNFLLDAAWSITRSRPKLEYI